MAGGLVTCFQAKAASMIALGIDTCGACGSLALARVSTENAADAALLAQAELAGRTYSAQLVPALRGLLQEQRLDIAAIEAVVVVNGPGSFTGIRVGVSSAKGFAEALAIPLLAVSRLAVLSWKAHTEIAALEAGRGEFYVRNGEEEALLSAADTSSFAGPVAACEAGARHVFSTITLVEPPTADDALRFAAPLLLAGNSDVVDSLDGNYLRRSEAEMLAKMPGKI